MSVSIQLSENAPRKAVGILTLDYGDCFYLNGETLYMWLALSDGDVVAFDLTNNCVDFIISSARVIPSPHNVLISVVPENKE